MTDLQLEELENYFKPKGDNIPPTPIQVETEEFLSGQPEQIEKIKENGGSRT